jgi:hypothetical protein
MDTMDQISILLKEYDSVRAEIRARTDNQFQLLAFAGVAAGWVLSEHVRNGERHLLVALLVPFLWFLFWNLLQVIKRCGNRLVEIEKQINGLAGEHLLEWETRWGWRALGWFRSQPRHWQAP